jgi:hypothetical protein
VYRRAGAGRRCRAEVGLHHRGLVTSPDQGQQHRDRRGLQAGLVAARRIVAAELGAQIHQQPGPRTQQPVTAQTPIGPDRAHNLVVDHPLAPEPGQRPNRLTLAAQLQLGAVADGACGGPASWWRRCSSTCRRREPFGRCQARSFRLFPAAAQATRGRRRPGRAPRRRGRGRVGRRRGRAGRHRGHGGRRRDRAHPRPARGRWRRLLGLPSPRLSRPHPSVIRRLGRDPLPLHLLDNLLGDIGSLREDDRARPRSCWNASSRATPRVAATIPLACSIRTRLDSACRS